MMEDYIGPVDTKESRKIIQDIEKEIHKMDRKNYFIIEQDPIPYDILTNETVPICGSQISMSYGWHTDPDQYDAFKDAFKKMIKERKYC